LEILNENDVHLREFADMIDHLQPKITEFLIEFDQIKTKQEQLNHQAKVRDSQYFLIKLFIYFFLQDFRN
jgi:hypothetical protein